MVENTKEILNKLNSLLTPLESPNLENGLHSLLKQKLGSLDVKEENDVIWTYTTLCASLLKQLHFLMLCVEGDKDLGLSVKEQKNIGSVVQLIISLGIVPNLLPGVGLPLEKRTKFTRILCESSCYNDDEKYRRIVFIIQELLFLIYNNKILGSLIVSKNFGDILAALIQLSYAPIRKPETLTNELSSMSSDKYETLLSEQRDFKTSLKEFLKRVYQPLAVRYLLVLQSGGGAGEREKNNNNNNILITKVPKWLKKIVGELLSTIVMESHGILHIIRGVLDICSDAEDSRKYEIIAGVLAVPPSSFTYTSSELYYAKICPQILEVLNLKDETLERTYHLIASSCIRSISERSLIYSRRYLFEPLMRPLLDINTTNITEETLDICIRNLTMTFVIGNDPSITFIHHLEPVMRILLELHVSIVFGVSHLRSSVSELILRYCKMCNLSVTISLLRQFAFQEKGTNRTIVPNESLIFIPGDNGGVKTKFRAEHEHEDNFYVADDEKAIAIVDLLSDISKDVLLEFFLLLIEDLSSLMSSSSSTPLSDSPKDLDLGTEDKLAQLELDLDTTMTKLRKNLMIIRLLGLLSEDESLLNKLANNSTRMIHFISLSIHRASLQCKNKSEMELMENQSLSMALSILSCYLTMKDISLKDWTQLQDSLTHLHILKTEYPDPNLALLASRLYQLIATHGVILNETASMKEQSRKIVAASEKMSQLCSEIKKLKESPYEAACQNLKDPLIPLRGHGLIELTRLLNSNDSETVSHSESLIYTFASYLSESDTYIYLSAINGLVAVSRIGNSEKIIQILVDEFTSVQKSVEIKTKVGEALVKITELLGDVTVKYKNILLNAFLLECRHEDELIRTSAFSNLGQLCKNLRFNLGSILYEILHLLDDTIKYDSALEVRRSSVFVLTSILQGLGQNSFSVLKDVLKDIYRSLKNLEKIEEDNSLRIHVENALNEIDKIVRQFLTPDRNLQKTIYVLNSPPDVF